MQLTTAVAAHQQLVGGVAEEGEPAVRQHDRVELVAVEHQQLRPSAVVWIALRRISTPPKFEPGELAEHLVMVAGDVDHLGAALGALQQAPDDVVVRARPVVALLHPPAVDDVADQVQRLAVDMIEEVDQHPALQPRVPRWMSEIQIVR